MATRSIPIAPMDTKCVTCNVELTEKLSKYECSMCGDITPKTLPKYYAPITSKIEAYSILADLFDIRILDVPAFVAEMKYRPIHASVFVISAGGSYSYPLNNTSCSVLNGTLRKYGNLQIDELQRAYLAGDLPNLPVVKRSGLGYPCPACTTVTYISAKKTTLLCVHCKCMFYI